MSSSFPIGRGDEVEADGRRYQVELQLSNSRIQAKDIKSGDSVQLTLVELRSTQASALAAIDPGELDKNGIEEAHRRRSFVRPLLDIPHRTRADVERSAREAGCDISTMYDWMKLYQCTRRLSSLMPYKPTGGKGKPRVEDEIENILQLAIKDVYLNRQRKSIKKTYDYVRRLCRQARLEAPGYTTLRRRINAIPKPERLKARGYTKEITEQFKPRPGQFTAAKEPLAVVQLDHTLLDIILLDEEYRQPVGRPSLTAVIDVATRGILGYYLSLDPTGRLSTSLALAHAILPKDACLAKLGVTYEWPFRGRPKVLIVDNAREFDCPWLIDACAELGIELNFRPVKTPRYGAFIERFFGTLEPAVHELPGTTWSNPEQRGDYESDRQANMTLAEFEMWLLDWICTEYHASLHSGILTTPLQAWNDGILGTPRTRGIGLPDLEKDPELLRLNLLPSFRKTIQPTGVQHNYIRYYSPVINRYIGMKNADGTKPTFLFRFDPRDLGTIYFWDPEAEQYFPVEYRTPHPPMSTWEYLAHRRQLKAEGMKHVDEDAIFAARARREELVAESGKRTRSVRRMQERRKIAERTLVDRPRPEKIYPAPEFPVPYTPTTDIQPYEVDTW